MKNGFLILVLIAMPCTTFGMEKEEWASDKSTYFCVLPSELKKELKEFIKNMNEAKLLPIEKEIYRYYTRASSDTEFAEKFFNDEEYAMGLIGQLSEKFIYEFKGEGPWLAALFLNTPGAKQWLADTKGSWEYYGEIIAYAQQQLSSLDRLFTMRDNKEEEARKIEGAQEAQRTILALMNDASTLDYIKKYKSCDGATALILSAVGNYKDNDLLRALLMNGADVNAKTNNTRDTALIAAARWGNKDAVALLLKAGANINEVDKNGEDALMIASYSIDANKDTLRVLLDNGADIDAKNKDGNTALILAARWGNKDAVAMLLEAGADADAKNKYGKKAGDSFDYRLNQSATKEITTLLRNSVRNAERNPKIKKMKDE